jgi:uncharacterized protein YbaA (DUF1428 family)
MDIPESQLTEINRMIDDNESESKIIAWIESQKNSEQIFEWFNKFMQGYVVEPKKK